MTIDPDTGAIAFPSGFAADAGLTQSAFRAGSAFAHARVDEAGVRPWIHYRLPGGELDGHPLLIDVLFHAELLVTVTVAADLYPPGPKDWSNYSLDVEAATKDFHDRLLEGQLGAPAESPAVSAAGLTPAQATLARPRRWAFAWGAVSSVHDTKGGGTFLMVQYGDRRAEAERAFRARK